MSSGISEYVIDIPCCLGAYVIWSKKLVAGCLKSCLNLQEGSQGGRLIVHHHWEGLLWGSWVYTGVLKAEGLPHWGIVLCTSCKPCPFCPSLVGDEIIVSNVHVEYARSGAKLGSGMWEHTFSLNCELAPPSRNYEAPPPTEVSKTACQSRSVDSFAQPFLLVSNSTPWRPRTKAISVSIHLGPRHSFPFWSSVHV